MKKLLCSCTVGFYDQASSWSSSSGWTKELCSQQPFLVGDWSRVLGSVHLVSHVLGVVHQNERLSLQAITSKGIPAPSINLQLNYYPNTQLDLFCNDNLSMQCTTSNTWLTNCTDSSTRLQLPTREGCWLQSFSIHHTMKIKKMLGHKTLRCTNTTTSSQERWIRVNSISGHNLLKQTLLNTCATCSPLTAFKIILLYV